MNRINMVLESEHETIIELADLVGAENTLKLIDNFSGSNIYIPSIEMVERKYRDMNIYNDFLSGMNYSELRYRTDTERNSITLLLSI